MIDRPILFVGSTRSGKSMIGKMLGELPDFMLAFEPLGIWNYKFSDNSSDVRSGDDASEEVCREIRRRIEKTVSSSEAGRYIDDLPHHALRIGFCHAVLPDARFVMVSRDGRSSVRDMKWGWERKDTLGGVIGRQLLGGNHKTISVRKLPMRAVRWLNNAVRRRLGARRTTWGPTVPGQFAFARSHTLIETIAFQWASYVEHALDGLDGVPSEQVLHLRFEEVLENPEAEMRRLAEFCGVENPQNLVDIAQRTLDKGRKPYSGELSSGELELIQPIISSLQTRLGYTH